MRALLFSVLLAIGCGAAPTPPLKFADGALTPAGLSEDKFGVAMEALLTTEPKSVERARILEAVLQRHFARAGYHFRTHRTDAALVKMAGAVAVLRTGELRETLLGAEGYETLKAASREYSKQGDEGRAEATFSILGKVGPEPERADARSHLDAISKWNQSFEEGGIAGLGTSANAAVMRYLSDVSESSRVQAVTRVEQWHAKALAVREGFRRSMVVPSRVEVNESIRATATAPVILACLHLRNYDPAAALSVLERAEARAPYRALSTAIASVAKEPNSENWLLLARLLRTSGGGQGESETEDLEVVRSAAFTAALEAYRLDRQNPNAALEVALRLREFGFAEAAPSILVAAAEKEKSPQFVSAVLTILLASIKTELQAEDDAAARRAFANGRRLLELAGPNGKDVAARILATMGELEAREGNLERAQALYASALGKDTYPDLAMASARALVHRGKLDEAIALLTQAVSIAKNSEERMDVQLQLADTYRLKRDVPRARSLLLEVLATKTPNADALAVERMQARVYARFDAREQTKRALLLALEHASRDKQALSAVIAQVTAYALEVRDPDLARAALARGIDGGVSSGELIYSALWTKLSEAPGKVPDPAIERIFSAHRDDPRWVGTIAQFGLGQMRAQDLRAKARTAAEKCEANFYSALDRRSRQESPDADLNAAISTGATELMEYSIAKTLLGLPSLGPTPGM